MKKDFFFSKFIKIKKILYAKYYNKQYKKILILKYKI